MTLNFYFMYVIAVDIKGFKYFLKATTGQFAKQMFSFEGLVDNADKYSGESRALTAIAYYQKHCIWPLSLQPLP